MRHRMVGPWLGSILLAIWLLSRYHKRSITQTFSRTPIEIDPQPHLSLVRATGIDIISSPQDANLVHSYLETRYGERIALLDFPSVTAAHAPQASKGNALRMMAEELQIDRDNVLAIGDSVNDVSMLSWAGQSATPSHCDSYARQAAKEILSGDGVAGVIARLRQVFAMTFYKPYAAAIQVPNSRKRGNHWVTPALDSR